MEMEELEKCNVIEIHVNKSIMMGIPCPPICVVHFWKEEVRVRFHHILGILGIFGKIRGPFFLRDLGFSFLDQHEEGIRVFGFLGFKRKISR